MMAETPLTDLLAEARDELQWRRWVYPRRVMDKIMTLDRMQQKIALQEAIVANLQEQVEREHGAAVARKIQPIFARRAH